ncbi:MAG: metal-dependent transcriptional regulator [Clostridiales bacterium]|nr:metal-dependent transcriptional regulator [Clostridiales bacterium]
MKIQESGENYLEMILILKNKIGLVRSVDIARAMSFTRPSISRAMSIMKKAGYITMDREGYIELTESGLKIAERIYNRHRLLTDWLTAIGVNKKTAAEDACRMEHIISQETFDRIKDHMKR